MFNDPCYSPGSADNLRTYTHEYRFDADPNFSCKHGVTCLCAGYPDCSAILIGLGGASGVHERSCVLLDNRCLVAVGNRLVALALPDLTLLWERVGDYATCFGLHLTADEQFVVVHGEMQISKFTVDGCKLWSVGGRDIFTGTCELTDGVVVATDFNDERYVIDLERGNVIASQATTSPDESKIDTFDRDLLAQAHYLVRDAAKMKKQLIDLKTTDERTIEALVSCIEKHRQQLFDILRVRPDLKSEFDGKI